MNEWMNEWIIIQNQLIWVYKSGYINVTREFL